MAASALDPDLPRTTSECADDAPHVGRASARGPFAVQMRRCRVRVIEGNASDPAVVSLQPHPSSLHDLGLRECHRNEGLLPRKGPT